MPRLLFVDDDEDILDLMTRFFSLRQFTVATAKDRAAMFLALQQQSFDLVVLNVMLPMKMASVSAVACVPRRKFRSSC